MLTAFASGESILTDELPGDCVTRAATRAHVFRLQHPGWVFAGVRRKLGGYGPGQIAPQRIP